MNSKEIYDVIVIGGGASGMMAAGRAAELGKRVLLLEKNKQLGEKLKITGGGRCNITNAEENERILLGHYGKSEQFLYSSFAQFGMTDTFSFFESWGLPLVVQARKRAFPKTEKALDVFDVLMKYLDQGKVIIKSGIRVTAIEGEKGLITGVVCDKEKFVAKSYILATGGKSHPETGSTGDGFLWLKNLGHEVKEPTPTIVPLAVEEMWVKLLAGVSLSFMKINFYLDGKKKFSITGKILFTHFGLSGPLILNSASKVADLLHEGSVTATIDAFPDTDFKDLDKKIMEVFDNNKNKTLKNVFKEIAPKGTAQEILSLLPEVNGDLKIHSVTKEQRKKLTHLLKALPLTVSGLMGFDRAVIADGGVAVNQIDGKTMRSKLYKNLYVTGDLLHISRPSGGYSLQLCWTTGFVAGSNA
jgi:predicted Rossmann fold flavoprotein